MNIVVIEPPVDPVVLLDDVKMHLRWDDDGVNELDLLLEGYIEGAITFVEQATRRALGIQTIQLSAPGFRGLELLRPPFREIVGVSYYDGEDVLRPLDLSDFYVTAGVVPSLLAYARVSSYCSDIARRDDAVQVTYKVGYDRDALPKGLKIAVLLTVQLLADRFDANEKADLERTRDALLSSFKVHNFFG